MRILAVDDEPLQLKQLERAIRQAIPDADVWAFDNPSFALAWAKLDTPSVAFCDINMPIINGVQLAKALKKLNPKMNIVFVTAYYTEYAVDVLPLRFSGYLQKPATPEAVKMEMENLRFPLPREAGRGRLTVQCFGNFNVTTENGTPVRFERSKTKELLAFLIDRRGAPVNGNEICAVLYENGSNELNNKSDLRKCVADLKASLQAVNAEDVFLKGYNTYSIDPTLLDCDYYDWEKGEAYAVRAFRGEYMKQYSWAESTLAYLLR